MSNRHMESFRNYASLLNQTRVWESESSGAAVLIEEMPRRYVQSAYDKLLRWARTFPAATALSIGDPANRVAFVANSPLAKALADRAEGLSPAKAEPAKAVTPRAMILVFVPILAEQTDLDISTCFKVAETLATRADELWTTTVPSR